MQEPDKLTGLFEDRLTHSIKEYVFGLLPSDEQNTGIALDVFTLSRKPHYEDGRIRSKLDVNNYCIATLTDKALRLHHLDNWWELSEAGYRYYERARKEGRHRSLRNYDTVIDRYGHMYCHLPNQIGIIEIPRQEIIKTSISTCTANRYVKFHIKDNHMLEIDDFVSLEVESGKQALGFYSVYKGVRALIGLLN